VNEFRREFLWLGGLLRDFVKHLNPKQLVRDISSFKSQFSPLLSQKDFLRRCFITILLIIAWHLGSFIPLPFLNSPSLIGSGRTLGLFTLGFMPYINAHVIALLLWCIPAVRRHIRSQDGQRKALLYIAFGTLAIATIQSLGLLSFIMRVPISSSDLPVLSSGWHRYAVVGSMIGGVGISLYVVYLINKFGIGHGFSLIMLSTYGGDIWTGMREFAKGINIHRSLFEPFYIGFVLLLVCLAGYLILQKRKIKLKENTHIQIPFFLSGFLPLIYASIITIPITLLSGFDISNLSITYFIVSLPVILFAYYIYDPIMFDSKSLVQRVNQNLPKDSSSVKPHRIASIGMMALFWGLLVMIFEGITTSSWEVHTSDDVITYASISADALLICVGIVVLTFSSIVRRKDWIPLTQHSDDTYLFEIEAILSHHDIQSRTEGLESYGRIWSFQIGPLAQKVLYVRKTDFDQAQGLFNE